MTSPTAARDPSVGSFQATARTRVPGLSETFVACLAAAAAALAVFNPAASPTYGFAACVIVLVMRFNTITIDALNVSAVALLALHWASEAWSVAPLSTSFATRIQLIACVHLLAVRLACRSKRGLRIVCWGTVLGSFAVFLRQLDSVSGPSVAATVRYGARLSLDGVNPNYHAYALATALFLAVILWHLSGSRATRAALAGLSLCFAVGVFLAGTRGALLSILLLAAWLVAVRLVRVRIAYRYLLICASVVAAAITLGLLDDIIRSEVVPSAREDGDLNGRLRIWPQARQLFEDRPILGHGAGTFQAMNPLHIGAHNAFLEIGSGLGIVGLLVLVGALAAAVRRRSTASDDHTIALGAFVTVNLPILLSGYWSQSTVLWMALGIAASSAPHFGESRHSPRAWRRSAAGRSKEPHDL